MTTHRLVASQLVELPQAEAFAFFSRPRNLGRLTPASMAFEYTTDDEPMRSGLEIGYRIRPLFGVPVRWLTRIDAYDPPWGFSDIQLRGPYSRWEHRHSFQALNGSTLIHDEIGYGVPGGPLGELLHRHVIANELEWIFLYRAWAVRTILAKAAAATGRTVAVAGGTGFVGSAIASELRSRGDRVVVLSHRGEEARGTLPDDVEIRRADARTGVGLDEALKGVDALAIALAHRNLPIESPGRHQTFEAVDANGTVNLVAAARRASVSRLAYVSGAGAAPDARNHWFRAKWRAESAVRASGIPWTIVRPTWIYGPRDVSLNRFLGFARRLPVVPLTNTGRQRLAPVFVDDAAKLVADSLTDDAARDQTFEIGGPDEMSMRQVIGIALEVAGIRRPVVPGPTALLKAATLPLRLLPEPPLTPAAIDFVNQPATVDTRPLLERMPRRLTPFAEGLRAYLVPAAPGSISIDGERMSSHLH